MRAADVSQPTLFITRTVADFVPPNHPLRALRELIDEALAMARTRNLLSADHSASTGR